MLGDVSFDGVIEGAGHLALMEHEGDGNNEIAVRLGGV